MHYNVSITDTNNDYRERFNELEKARTDYEACVKDVVENCENGLVTLADDHNTVIARHVHGVVEGFSDGKYPQQPLPE